MPWIALAGPEIEENVSLGYQEMDIRIPLTGPDKLSFRATPGLQNARLVEVNREEQCFRFTCAFEGDATFIGIIVPAARNDSPVLMNFKVDLTTDNLGTEPAPLWERAPMVWVCDPLPQPMVTPEPQGAPGNE